MQNPHDDRATTRWRAALAPCALLLLGACAGLAPAPAPAPTAAEVASLEGRVAADPSDAEALIALGHAYRLSGRTDDAVATLERARREAPDDGRATLLLGLSFEDQERFAEARLLYEEHLRSARSSRLSRQVRDRLVLVRRAELRAAAREAVLREAELAATPPRPRTVAVFPFVFLGGDEQLRPLTRALADLLVTDLSQTDRMTVLERTQTQALVDEARLAEAGLVDPATAARGGRLLGAERVVQGSVGGNAEALQVDAAVVLLTSEVTPEVRQLRESDALSLLFDMEKRLALELYRSMGIELTPAEEQRVTRRATSNVQALLAYGLGLEASDAGDFAAAEAHFTRALALDPDFAAARAQRTEVERAASASTVTTAQIAQAAVAEAGPGVTALQAESLVPAFGERDAVSEVLGREGVGAQGAIIRILIRGQGGAL